MRRCEEIENELNTSSKMKYNISLSLTSSVMHGIIITLFR